MPGIVLSTLQVLTHLPCKVVTVEAWSGVGGWLALSHTRYMKSQDPSPQPHPTACSTCLTWLGAL